jgi:hypothetical protein
MVTLVILLVVAVAVGILLGAIAKMSFRELVAECFVLAVAAGGFFALTRLL